MIFPRAVLGIDGNAAFALVGDNLQEGEAEFETIEGYAPGAPLDGASYRAAKLAINRCYQKLKARLGYPISYALDPSHPDFC